ncbi:acyl-CoA thioesterase [Brevibacterium limosum]|uniref:acyl-CoA thioesterase n=1 Tax=Brevibacterium limosum TaxID=2697565 RepID=UPI002B1BD36A|nr:acyl-CoA thioesterase [Brevibacterium limosum]
MRVHLGEIDIFMHLNNGKYFSIMDLGRLDMMVRSGAWQAMRDRGWTGVVSAETISFRKSLKLWQSYSLETKVCGVDERTVFFEQRMVVDGEIFARAFVATRLISENGTLTRDDLGDAFGMPEIEPELPDWIHDWRRHNSLPSTRRPAWHSWA